MSMEHPYGGQNVSRADEIGGRRRLSLAIVVRLYEPAGKAASRRVTRARDRQARFTPMTCISS